MLKFNFKRRRRRRRWWRQSRKKTNFSELSNNLYLKFNFPAPNRIYTGAFLAVGGKTNSPKINCLFRARPNLEIIFLVSDKNIFYFSDLFSNRTFSPPSATLFKGFAYLNRLKFRFCSNLRNLASHRKWKKKKIRF